MSGKRSKGKGKLAPFTALFRHTTKSAAWKALSVGARAVFFILQSNHNTNMQNSVWLSTRNGSAELGGVRPHNITMWLNELEFYGFVVKIEDYHLGVSGKGMAAKYRLTDRYYAGTAPTYDFQNWDGVLFEPKKRKVSDAEKARLNGLKKQNPVTRSVTPCDTVVHIGSRAKRTKIGNKRDTPVHIGKDPRCDTVVHIDSFTISQPNLNADPVPIPSYAPYGWAEEYATVFRSPVAEAA
jgi:hypothetical protein